MKFALLLVLFSSVASSVSAITTTEGTALANAVMTSMHSTLHIGDMKPMADELFADQVAWNWSGPQNGKGTRNDFVQEFANTWGGMVSAFLPGTVSAVTDTVANVVSFYGEVTINFNGRGLLDEACY